MKKITLTLCGLFLTVLVFGQSNNNQKLISLGKAYKDFMFRNEPAKNDLKEVNSNVPENLKTATEFIVQTITTKNKLLTTPYLSRPSDEVLKQIFIIRDLNLNMREEKQKDNNKLIDSLSAANIPTYELIDNYYEMLFAAVGNKNQPFNFSNVNFALKDYNFKDDTEKGIFFLRCMKECNMVIWGYMNIVKPPNTAKAYENIKKFPKFNGRPYYQYNDLYFQDFEMIIINDKGKQSYKGYYLDKYFETLLFHFVCMKQEKASDKEINDLLLGSILKDNKLYKYTNYKKVLEDLFKTQKQD